MSAIWSITSYRVSDVPRDGAIVRLRYQVRQEGALSVFGGLVDVKFDPQAPFTPLAELSQETLIGWAKTGLGAQAQALEAALAAEAESVEETPTWAEGADFGL